ncbi:MAG: transcriptional regulator [Gemmatimonadota bacterium]|nr:transcriptional regulator [Gemmatimonadota bacterium]
MANHPSLFDPPPSPSPRDGSIPAPVARAVALDPLIHERSRLGIVAALASGSGTRSFRELRDALSLSDGNLGAHLRRLEEAGVVECRKGFEERVPCSRYRLTVRGRASFASYLFRLESVLRATRGVRDAG